MSVSQAEKEGQEEEPGKVKFVRKRDRKKEEKVEKKVEVVGKKVAGAVKLSFADDDEY
jgi:hypothetical protein